MLGDAQQSVRYSRNQATGTDSRAAYRPFGQAATATMPASERGFLNKPTDPNGDVRLDHRNYQPALNTLTTPDALLDTGDPQSLNPYAYSRNNPVSLSDPSGLMYDDNSPVTSPGDNPYSLPGPACASIYCSDSAPLPEMTDDEYAVYIQTIRWSADLTRGPDGSEGILAWVAGAAAGAAVGGACTIATGGTGAFGCTIAGGVTGGVVQNALTPDADHSAAGTAKAGLFGGLVGALTGGILKGLGGLGRGGTVTTPAANTGPRALPIGPWGQKIVDARTRLPSSWGPGTPNVKGVGTRWFDPANKGNGIRIDQGLPGSSFASQQVDHVVVRSGGQILGPDGKPIVGSLSQNPQAHIPLSDWLTWSSWSTP